LKYAIKFAGVAIAAVAFVSLALAQEGRIYQEGGNWVQEVSGKVSAARNLHIKLDTGSVKVQGGSQADITFAIHRRSYNGSEERARREFQSNRITAAVKGDTAWIVAERSGRGDHRCSDELIVNVPRNLDLAKVETGGGSVNAAALTGRVEIETGGGSIHLDDIGNGVKAETGGGAIELGTVSGDVSLETGGGNIRINSVRGDIKAETGGGSVDVVSGMQGAVLQTGAGSIHLQKCNGRVKAETGGGSIDLGEIGGPVHVESGGGSIHLKSANGRVEAETGGGSIQLDGATSVKAETGAGGITVKLFSSSDARSNSTLETAAGDITVYLANDLPITVHASIEMATGHKIRTDFGDIHVSSEGGSWPGPQTVTADGQLNGGGPMLKVRTSSGNIAFLRASR
jgi:DUF4097 and DUF4098 domain-containing protein YvlB